MKKLTATQELSYGGKTYIAGEKFDCDEKYVRLLVALGRAEEAKRGRPPKEDAGESSKSSGENKGNAVPSEKATKDEAVSEKDDASAKKDEKKKLKDKRAKTYETRVMTAESE